LKTPWEARARLKPSKRENRRLSDLGSATKGRQSELGGKHQAAFSQNKRRGKHERLRISCSEKTLVVNRHAVVVLRPTFTDLQKKM